MKFSLKEKSLVEIHRICALGWEDSSPDTNGVRVFSNVDEDSISFPSEKYEADSNSSESEGIWSEIRARKIATLLKNRGIDVIWEIGAGHGNMAIPLAEEAIATIPIEPLYSGARALSSKGFHSYAQTLDQLNLPDNCLEAVGIFDVLEHLPNPEIVLNEIYRILKPGGVLLTSVPAYQWLFSDFDLQIGHFRRYSRKSLFKLLNESNFKQVRISNLFFIFIAPALILRRFPYLMGIRRRKKASVPTSENFLIKFLTPILRIFLLVEMRMRIPLGLSIFSEATK
ncbi:class I SAM-dependent methyltransferase [Candidatus Planktophila dulcis]|uniref:class I SAM-dependent methyltransferase n=1 Tax=Candidatus Planktophila dulcis TaxID=1884914 RepID=UPI003CF64CDC